MVTGWWSWVRVWPGGMAGGAARFGLVSSLSADAVVGGSLEEKPLFSPPKRSWKIRIAARAERPQELPLGKNNVKKPPTP